MITTFKISNAPALELETGSNLKLAARAAAFRSWLVDRPAAFTRGL